MKEDTPDYFRIAAGFYQCRDLPDDYLQMQEETFCSLLERNAWEPFEEWTGESIEEEIQALSAMMEKIARDAYKKGHAEGYDEALQDATEEQSGGREPVSIYEKLSTAYCEAIKK